MQETRETLNLGSPLPPLVHHYHPWFTTFAHSLVRISFLHWGVDEARVMCLPPNIDPAPSFIGKISIHLMTVSALI